MTKAVKIDFVSDVSRAVEDSAGQPSLDRGVRGDNGPNPIMDEYAHEGTGQQDLKAAL